MRRSPIRHTLAFLRSTLDLGQKEVAALLECHVETIKSIEIGRLQLSESLALRISLKTGVSVQWLLNNDLSAAIVPSSEAIELQRRCLDPEPHKYSRRTFELVHAQEWDITNVGDINQERLNGLQDYVRLRAIIETARYQRLHGLARYKLEKFLKEMEEEFSSDPARIFFKEAKLESENIIEFVEAELAAAKWLNHILYKADLSKELDETNWDYDAVDRCLIEALSPYEDRSDPKVAARINAAMAEAKARDERMTQRWGADPGHTSPKKKPQADKLPSAEDFIAKPKKRSKR